MNENGGSAETTATTTNADAATAADVGMKDVVDVDVDNDNNNGDNGPPSSRGDVGSSSPYYLSTIQTQEVDRAFRDLFGYPWGKRPVLSSSSSSSDDDAKQRRLTPRERILIKVLGEAGAASVLLSSSSTAAGGIASLRGGGVVMMERRRELQRRHHLTKAAAAALRRSSAKAGRSYDKPRVGTALPSASREATTTRADDAPAPPEPSSSPSSQQRPTGGGKAAAVGVDKLLKDLSGPEKATTISKTSSDWESFKADTGLATKLEEQAQSKDSFLNRQDFLQRVDQRRFEVERQERDRERSKRGV